MKQFKNLFLAVAFVMMAIGAGSSAYADIYYDVSLGADGIQGSFNTMNSNTGYRFTITTPNNNPSGLVQLNGYSGDQLGLTAYSDGVFKTFCVEPNSTIVPSTYYTGKLAFGWTSHTTFTTSQVNLAVGSALLYKQYITGNLSQRFTDDTTVGNAIRYLMGYGINVGNLLTDGWDNEVMQYLLTLNPNKSYWTANYNPDAFYTEIGNYSVYVMHVLGQPGNSATQDFLYVSNACQSSKYPNPIDPPLPPPGGGDPPVGSGVPEPATVLFWALGTLGAAGYARRRSTAMKKLAH